MAVNPFAKGDFRCHRAWEEALVAFLVREAKSPNLQNWLALSGDPGARKSAVFSALLLSNLLATKPGFAQSSKKAYEVGRALSGRRPDPEAFEDWLRSGWLNLSRIADLLAVALTR